MLQANHWTRGFLRGLPRENLERLARWLGVARPDVLPVGLLVHEIIRRGRIR